MHGIWIHGQTNALEIPEAILFSRLAETIAWCSKVLAEKPQASMRSPEIQPRLLHDGIDDAVCEVGNRRSWQARENSHQPVETFPDFLEGRLMVYFPDATLTDGVAELESQGFFDGFNIPPWDTWVSYFDDQLPRTHGYSRYLLAYVPQPLLMDAERGMVTNVEACIQWLADADVKLRTRMTQWLA